jgi:fructokinase
MSSSSEATSSSGRIRAVGIGEVLWDLLPEGKTLGGAPCNVMVNLARLGYDAAFITAVGADELGTAARNALVALGLDTSFVATVDRPTGRADVVVNENGVPEFRLAADVAYEAIDLSTADVDLVATSNPRALVFGTLALCSPTVRRSTAALASALPDALRVYDVNLRVGLWDEGLVRDVSGMATVIKLNEEEAGVLAPMFEAPWPGREAFSRALADREGVRAVAITAGSRGASLLLDGEFVEAPAPVVEVVDSIGAGDAFTAAMVDGLLRGWPRGKVLARSISLGSLVASRPGAMSPWTVDDLRELEERTAAQLS